MESLSEFLAQTSPICGGVGEIASSTDLNLGLIDLGSINWDLCDFVATTNTTTNLESQSTNHLEDERKLEETANQCFEGLDLLDFEVNEEVLMALNDFDNIHDQVNSPPILTDVSYTSQINSPSAEQTYTSISTAIMNVAPLGSPSEGDSVMNYYDSSSSSAEESPGPAASKLRRTRVRKIDKKASNKAAAIKYRTKKTKERESLFAECEEYERRNNELKKKIDETQSEISFIKSLLVEALIAKSVPK